MKQKAFTLQEVLAVVVIMLLIAGLIATVFPRAIARSQEGKCMTNLQQIGTALKLYADENNGYVPPVCTHNARASNGNSFIGEPIRFRSSIQSFSKGTLSFYCPLEKEGRSYEYSRFMIGPDNFGTREGNFMLNLDSPPEKWISQIGGVNRAELMTEPVWENSEGKDRTTHGSHVSVLFYDLHVEGIDMK